MHIKNSAGQSLFELIIAVLVVSLVMIALVALATKNVALTTFARDKTRANRYAQEVVEWLRGERDSNWATFRGHVTTSRYWCMQSLAWSNQGTCSTNEMISGTPFKRDLDLSVTGSDTVTAVVTITWSDGSGTHESRTTNIYTNWRGS